MKKLGLFLVGAIGALCLIHLVVGMLTWTMDVWTGVSLIGFVFYILVQYKIKKKTAVAVGLWNVVILLLAIYLYPFFTYRGIQGKMRSPSSLKPNHTIILIHGIAGSRDHFGSMEEALTRVLNKKNPEVNYRVTSIDYETGNDEKNTYLFAQDVHEQMIQIIGNAPLKEKDKISLVMHSQGGLVGSIWMLQSLLSTEGFGTPELVEHLDSFITLGTPFWGAKSAEFGRNIDGFFTQWGIDLKVPFGTTELRDMSRGSDTVYDFRTALVDPRFESHIQMLKQNVRFLNIAGTATVLNPLGVFAAGGENYEDDGAVLLPSARFNFLFSQSIEDDYQEEDIVSVEATREIDFAPCIVVEGLHRSPLPGMKALYDIVCVPEECIENENCLHPTFSYVWRHLLGKDVVSENENAISRYKSFLIDVNVRLPEEYAQQCQEIQISFMQKDGTPLDKSQIEISNFFELFSEGKNTSSKYPNQCRLYFTGNIHDEAQRQEATILMQVTAKGFKTRQVEVLLKSSYSTFVDLNLIP